MVRRRREVWWTELPAPAGKRPVVLLSRNEAYAVRELITIASVTTRIRQIPTEVLLGKEDGLPKRCVANLDTITTIPKAALTKRLNKLPAEKIAALERAQRFALDLPLK